MAEPLAYLVVVRRLCRGRPFCLNPANGQYLVEINVQAKRDVPRGNMALRLDLCRLSLISAQPCGGQSCSYPLHTQGAEANPPKMS